ncbi:peptide-binding protein [Neobacillus mesonae]|uniref:peptide-binding protein n=1 Tax=Neobacillus mesonae TaxID=1193713 RepID=UPI000833B607|nr:peptide-binding protein [Neobacillus mesonae]
MKKKSSVFSLGSLLLILFLLITGCSAETSTDYGSNTKKDGTKSGKEEVQQGGTLVLGTTASPTLFNPLYSTDTSSSMIEGFIYSGLVTIDREFNPVPDLAEKWENSDDGLTWTFQLRKGVKWHDGKDFTADDVVFTYSIPLSKDYKGPRGLSFETITKVEKVDDYTVKITLKEPYAPFLAFVGTSGILPKHILGDVPIQDLGKHEFNTKNPIGTGPFKFEEWKDGEYIKLAANDDYFLGKPKLDGIIDKIVPDSNALMAQMQTGEISLTSIAPEQMESAKKLEEQGKVKILSGPSNSWEYLGYNLRNPLFKDRNVRIALTHAIDKESIVKAILNGDGTVAHGPGSPANWAFNENMPKFEYDVNKAKELLKEAGWEKGSDGILQKDGKKFEFTIKTTSANETRQKIAQVVQEQFKQIGIKANIQLLEWSAYVKETSPPNWNFDAIVAGWSIGSDPDPTWFWDTNEIEKGLNYQAYSNQKVDELVRENTRIVDQQERLKIMHEVDQIVAEDQPATFLYYPNGHMIINPKLHGPIYNTANTYFEIEKWYFEK